MVEKSSLKPRCSVACFSADKFVGMVLSYPVEADLEITPYSYRFFLFSFNVRGFLVFIHLFFDLNTFYVFFFFTSF